MFRWTVSLAMLLWLAVASVSLFVDAPTIGDVSPEPGEDKNASATKANVATPAAHTNFLQRDGQPLIGFAVNLHYNDDRERYLQAIDDIADLGCNAVLFATPAFQTNGASSEIRIETGPGRGPYRERLIELIRRAKQHGMATALMPTVLFTNPRGGEWRGKIVPDSWDKWWQSYHRMTDHFVAIANEAGVDLYVVGSELLTTEKHAQRWHKVIDRVRQRFDGALTYSGNFDAYADPTFWDKLDLVAMNAYFDLTVGHNDDHPPMEHLVEQWREHRKRAVAYAKSQGKPLLFTEMGYPSAPWGLKDPWDYMPYDDTVADHAVQHDGYEAFFQTWSGDLKRTGAHNATSESSASFVGVFFYEWDPYRTGDAKDTRYGIRGKPAFDLIKARIDALRN